MLGLIMAIMGIVVACGSLQAAGDVYVLQDRTPIVSKPGIGGKILVWVDTGFPLTLQGHQGDWLRVSSPSLELPGDDLWVPAARVGDRLPGTFDIAYSDEGFASGPDDSVFQLAITGSQTLRVRANCRVVEDGDDKFVEVVDDVPLTLDLEGTAVDCTVRKLGSVGGVDVVLLDPDGRPAASASTFARRGRVRLRSAGPWGGAAGFALPTRFVVLKERPDVNLPPGNSVPPLGVTTPALGNPVPPFEQSPVMPQ